MSDLTISQIPQTLGVPEVSVPAGSSRKVADGPSFSEFLTSAIDNVNELQTLSDSQIRKFLAGEGPDVHSVILAVNKAELSFQLMMQVRNKLVQAYQELMRIQV